MDRPYNVEKALPNNKHLVRKLGKNEIHRMRVRLSTPRQPVPDVQTTSQEWKPDPEIIIKHDDLYAIAWESEYETPIFDNGRQETNNDISCEVTVRHDLPTGETYTTTGTIQEDSPLIFPHTDEVGDGTDTDHYMAPDAKAESEQLSATNVNPRSTKYDLRHNRKPNCNDDYR